MKSPDKREIFETMPVIKALLYIVTPTVLGQIVMFFYSKADTWYIGRTNDPCMVGVVSLVAVMYMLLCAISNLFCIGGGSMMVRLLGKHELDEARKTASYSIYFAVLTAFCFSALCLIGMDPLLYALGANANTIVYARQYLIFTVILGGIPTVLSLTLPALLRDAGYAKEAGAGVVLCGLMNVGLDPLFMFVLLPRYSARLLQRCSPTLWL